MTYILGPEAFLALYFRQKVLAEIVAASIGGDTFSLSIKNKHLQLTTRHDDDFHGFLKQATLALGEANLAR